MASRSGTSTEESEKVAIEFIQELVHVQHIIHLDRIDGFAVRLLGVVRVFIDQIDGSSFDGGSVIVLANYRGHERLTRAFRAPDRKDPQTTVSTDDAHIIE
ncbi:MAG: hypothetical protein WD401_05870 [Thermomicrobiaceae bacterium]